MKLKLIFMLVTSFFMFTGVTYACHPSQSVEPPIVNEQKGDEPCTGNETTGRCSDTKPIDPPMPAVTPIPTPIYVPAVQYTLPPMADMIGK